MNRIILYAFIILMLLFTGCRNENSDFPKKEAFVYRNNITKLTKGINTLDISLDSCNLEIYCWDKKELKYEAKHTVRDNKTQEELDKLLNKYTIKYEELEKTFFLSAYFSKKNKNYENYFTDLKLTIPKNIKHININQKSGSLIVEDRYEGNLNAQLNRVNSEIGDLKGQIIVKCENGNFRLNSGKLINESAIELSSGNIFVKAECESQSKYLFTTQEGNINLHFPVSSSIFLDSFGTVQNNQFTGIDGDIAVTASTKMGRISVNGY